MEAERAPFRPAQRAAIRRLSLQGEKQRRLYQMQTVPWGLHVSGDARVFPMMAAGESEQPGTLCNRGSMAPKRLQNARSTSKRVAFYLLQSAPGLFLEQMGGALGRS